MSSLVFLLFQLFISLAIIFLLVFLFIYNKKVFKHFHQHKYNKQIIYLRIISCCALLISLSAVLHLFSISLPFNNDIDVADSPIYLSGLLFGPFFGFCTGIICEAVSNLIKPPNFIFAGFILSHGLKGFISGMFVYFFHVRFSKFKNKYQRNLIVNLLALLVSFLFVEIILNALWQYIIWEYANKNYEIGGMIFLWNAIASLIEISVEFSFVYSLIVIIIKTNILRPNLSSDCAIEHSEDHVKNCKH